MELAKSEVFKLNVLTVKEFCKLKEMDGVTATAIYYAIKHGLVDYIPIGRENIIVMTDHTRQYVPNKHPKRIKPSKQNTKTLN